MTTSKSVVYRLVIVLCAVACVYGRCFNDNRMNTARVSVTKLHESIEAFAPAIFKAAVYKDFFNDSFNFAHNDFNSTMRLRTSIWLGLLSAYFREIASNWNNYWYNINEDSSVILQRDALEHERRIFNGTVQSNNTDNILISPMSIWFAMLTVYFGARNKSSEELGKLLEIGAGLDKDALAVKYRQLQSEFQDVNNHKNILKIANKFYVFDRPIYKCVKNFFGSEFEELGRYDYDGSTHTINEWVKEQTDGKIETFLPRGVIYHRTHMILANAVYFKGKWAKQFYASKTKKEDFYQNALRTTTLTTVDMMATKHNFYYTQSSTLHCTAVELLYEGNEISMIALLPHKDNSAENLAASLTKTKLKDLYSDMYFQKLNLHFPKFRIQHSFELDAMLNSLGLEGLFIEGISNLTGFNDNDRLHLGKVRHSAFVEVDEKGAQLPMASAAQHLEPYVKKKLPEVYFNHPFVFIIRYRNLNSTLFMGLVRRPTI